MYDPRKGQQNLSALCLIYWSYFGTILCINTLRFWLIILISIFLWIVWLIILISIFLWIVWLPFFYASGVFWLWSHYFLYKKIHIRSCSVLVVGCPNRVWTGLGLIYHGQRPLQCNWGLIDMLLACSAAVTITGKDKCHNIY